MQMPSRETLDRLSVPPSAENLRSKSADWRQAHEKLQTVYGADQSRVDNAHQLIQTSARVHNLLSGEGSETQREERAVMRGYTGHVPGARHVVATTFRGPSQGNGYRGPKHPPVPFMPPKPPDRCSEGV